ncbi:MAG: ABC-type transport system involved in cytochrome c biosis, permease component [Acidimicrobiales bacterium]|nr:ABC-type transport system involved in cytochrome c biosis, permease component [Acidimicrobiales bacterium]
MTPDNASARDARPGAAVGQEAGRSPAAGFWRLDPEGTASRGSRVLGAITLVGLAVFLFVALVASPPDSGKDASVNVMGEAVRIMYVHVPVAIVCFLSFGVTALAGALYLWRKSEGWDLLAAASAEVGVVFTALTLATGSIWGKFAWGAWWVWDARLTTTALLLVLFLGYLALRRAIADPVVRAKRAAIAGLIGFADVPIVHFSVDWWRSLHQTATITRFNPTIDGLKLFALMFGMVVFLAVYAWLMVHRFRLQYVQARVEERGLDAAIAERRAEAAATPPSSLAGTGAAR